MSRYKIYDRPSVRDMFAHATTEDEVRTFLVEASTRLQNATKATRRAWQAAADAKLAQLRKDALLQPRTKLITTHLDVSAHARLV